MANFSSIHFSDFNPHTIFKSFGIQISKESKIKYKKIHEKYQKSTTNRKNTKCTKQGHKYKKVANILRIKKSIKSTKNIKSTKKLKFVKVSGFLVKYKMSKVHRSKQVGVL